MQRRRLVILAGAALLFGMSGVRAAEQNKLSVVARGTMVSATPSHNSRCPTRASWCVH